MLTLCLCVQQVNAQVTGDKDISPVVQSDDVSVAACNKRITVQIKEALGSIAVNDMTGRLLKMVKLEQNLHCIDMDGYADGIYTVTVRSIKGTKAFKISL